MRNTILLLLSGVLLGNAAPLEPGWRLWQSYTAYFMDPQGRIMDHDAGGRTTSEGESYALFFSLVANDRARFDRLLSWTERHLAEGSLATHLPAWLWENKNGAWQIADRNSAADADLWLAYTLLEGGRLWHDNTLSAKGTGLAQRIADHEVENIPQLGLMLLPGSSGFHTSDGYYLLNPSYLPVQLLLALQSHFPGGPWGEIAGGVPHVLQGAAPGGFILDWIAYRPGDGFSPYPTPAPQALASYDAVRVYLWAGMLAENSPYRSKVMAHTLPMSRYVESNGLPPAEVSPSGQIKNSSGNLGFSAAMLPLLSVLNAKPAFERQQQRLNAERNARTGLYVEKAGDKPRYYDQNLALFATGWCEGRFRFDQRGLLQVNWK